MQQHKRCMFAQQHGALPQLKQVVQTQLRNKHIHAQAAASFAVPGRQEETPPGAGKDSTLAATGSVLVCATGKTRTHHACLTQVVHIMMHHVKRVLALATSGKDSISKHSVAVKVSFRTLMHVCIASVHMGPTNCTHRTSLQPTTPCLKYPTFPLQPYSAKIGAKAMKPLAEVACSR